MNQKLIIERPNRILKGESDGREYYSLCSNFIGFLDLEFEGGVAKVLFGKEIVKGGKYKQDEEFYSLFVPYYYGFKPIEIKSEELNEELEYQRFKKLAKEIKPVPIKDYQTVKKIDTALEKITKEFKSEGIYVITRIFLNVESYEVINE